MPLSRYALASLCALLALGGCSGARGDIASGGPCVRTSQCTSGLACVGGVCTRDLTALAEAAMVPILPDGAPSDAGSMMGADSGPRPRRDAGGPGMDAGPPPRRDSGPPAMDAGPPAMDAGTPAMDAGTPAMDAGTPAMDAGPPAMDAGPPPAPDGGPDTGA